MLLHIYISSLILLTFLKFVYVRKWELLFLLQIFPRCFSLILLSVFSHLFLFMTPTMTLFLLFSSKMGSLGFILEFSREVVPQDLITKLRRRVSGIIDYRLAFLFIYPKTFAIGNWMSIWTKLFLSFFVRIELKTGEWIRRLTFRGL